MINVTSPPYSIDQAIPLGMAPFTSGGRLAVLSNGSLEVIPKSIGEIVGERIVRPLIDFSYPFVQYAFSAVHQLGSAFHRTITGINIFSVAEAQVVYPKISNYSIVSDSWPSPRLFSLQPLLESKECQECFRRIIGAKHIEKFQSVGQEDIKELLEVFDYIGANAQVLSTAISEGSIPDLPNQFTSNIQKFAFEQLMKSLYAIQGFRRWTNTPSLVWNLYKFVYLDHKSQSDYEKGIQMFKTILSNRVRAKEMLEDKDVRHLALFFVMPELKSCIIPMELNRTHGNELREAAEKFLDITVPTAIHYHLFDFLEEVNGYVTSDKDMEQLVQATYRLFYFISRYLVNGSDLAFGHLRINY